MKRILPILIFLPTIIAGLACTTIGVDRSKNLGQPVTGIPVGQVPVNGYSVIVRLRSSDSKPGKYSGELLAVDQDSVWIMPAGRPAADARPFPIERSKIEKIEIIDLYPSSAGGLAAWTALGTLSTASHGFLAVLSVPLWLGVGIPTTVAAAYANDMVAEPEKFHMLYQWARYPQGMPVADSQRTVEPLVVDKGVLKKVEPEERPELEPAAEPPGKTGTIPNTEAQKKQPLDIQNVGAFTPDGIRTLWALGRASASAGQSAKETITSTTLEGTQIIDRWVDPQTGEFYSVAVIPLSKSGLPKEQAELLFNRLVKELPAPPQRDNQTEQKPASITD
jgi:hypothetical protein